MREEATGTRVQVADAGSQPRLGWRRKMTVEWITGGQVGRRWSTVSGGQSPSGRLLGVGLTSRMLSSPPLLQRPHQGRWFGVH